MEYLIHIGVFFGVYAILAMGLNLIVGYAGLVSVTHAAFFGIGAYATAILGTALGMNFFVSLFFGMALAGILSWLIGWILSRLGGDYYVLGTVGFNYIVFSVLINWDELTRGPLGIPGISRPALGELVFASNASFLLLLSIALFGLYWAVRAIVHSSFGRVLKGIREDEEAIKVFGYNTLFYKLTVFGMGAILAAVAGAFYASYIAFIDPTSFAVMESVFILAIVILGGLGSLYGPFVGAAFLILFPELIRFLGFPPDIAGYMRQLVYGLLLVLLMLYRPRGFVGEYKI